MGLAAFNNYYNNLDNEPIDNDITGDGLSGYALMHIEELRALALSLGISVHWKAGKDKIISQIEEHDNGQVEVVEDDNIDVSHEDSSAAADIEELEGGEDNGPGATQEDSEQGDGTSVTDE